MIYCVEDEKNIRELLIYTLVKSAAYSYEQKVTGKDFQKDESDS